MIQTIRTEAEALHALLHRESVAHRVSSTFWDCMHFVLGIGAAGLAGIAATSAGAHPLVTPQTAAMLEGITAAATGLMTMLKPSEVAGRQKQYGDKYRALGGDVGHFATVSLMRAGSFAEVDEQLKGFQKRRDALAEEGPGFSALSLMAALTLVKVFKDRPLSPLPQEVFDREASGSWLAAEARVAAPEPIGTPE